ncbi:MAG: two-component regulator propeller domain-containing protein [Thermodesulfobacteriota bacterium]
MTSTARSHPLLSVPKAPSAIRLVPMLTLCAALFAWSPAAAAPPIHFFHIGSDDGLPQVTIRTLLKTRRGHVWAGTEDGLARLGGADLKVFKKSLKDEASLSDNYISSLAEGPDGTIWVGTLGNGLNAVSPDGRTVRRIAAPSIAHEDILALMPGGGGLWLGTTSGLKFLPQAGGDALEVKIELGGAPFRGKVKAIAQGEGCLWLATKGQGLARHVPGGETRWFAPGSDGLEDKTFNSLFKDASGRLWAGSENAGLVEILDTGDGVSFRHYTKQTHGLGANDLMAVADAGGGRLWLGSWGGGLQLFDPAKGVLATYRRSLANPNSICSDIVMTILAGDGPDVWIGSSDRGLSRFDSNQAFMTFTYDPLASSGIPDPMTWAFAQDGEGSLWIGTSKGLSLLDPASFTFSAPQFGGAAAKALAAENVRAFAPFPGGMWAAARKTGVVRVDLASKTADPLAALYGGRGIPAGADVRLLLLDQDRSELWAGLSEGLIRLDIKTGGIRTYRHSKTDPSSLPHDRIRALHRDRDGRIWVGTSLGLALLNEDGEGFTVFKRDPASPGGSLAGDGIRAIAQDQTGLYWIGTETGISLFSPGKGVVKNLREEDGLPNNSVYAIVPADGFMWASTMRGLVRIDPRSLSMERYFKRDGLPDNEFNFNAWGRLASGELVFGGVNGFTLFNPSAVPCPENGKRPPALELTPLAGSQSGPSARGGELRLGWKAPNIVFRFNALAYEPPGSVHYRVRLSGAESGWRETRDMEAAYAGLSPGSYVFEVAASDDHGQWTAGPESIRFSVDNPPWMRWPALLAYAILLAGLMAALARAAASRQRRRAAWLEAEVARRSVQLAESNALLEERNASLARLMESRERLFRSLAHELRTPLSVIITALESRMESFAGAGRQAAQLALASAGRLSSLIKAILDVARGNQAGKETLFDAGKALEDTLAPFRLLAENQGRILSADIAAAHGRWLSMDRELFIAAVGNLVSNAFKYGPGEARVEALAEGGSLRVIVSDDGEGIAEEDIPAMFEWFARGTNDSRTEGWGIGLPTAREAVEKYGGTLSASRAPGGGTRFIVEVPLSPEPPSKDAFEGSAVRAETDAAAFTGRKGVLVEDDPDLREQLTAIFHGFCEVTPTPDAEAGWKAINSIMPDFVVSDVMLPGPSGFDLVTRMKENVETSHIPVILISAYDEAELRRAGFSVSADACLAKPVRRDELLLRTGSLLRNRELAARRIKRAILFEQGPPKEDGPGAMTDEQDLLARIREVMTPLENVPSLTVGDVARSLGMSQRSLQRALEKTGVSWSEFKRLHQLRNAMDLLRAGNLNITEVAMRCGFANSAYFAKIFKEHAGMTPSEWRSSASSGQTYPA